MKVLVLSSADIESSLELDGLRAVMAEALRKTSAGIARNFPRVVFPFTNSGVLGFMPAVGPGIAGFKAVSVYPGNRERGMNPHQGLVTLFDSETGVPQVILDGASVTALRTAAVSAVATDLLARSDSQVLALIGSGRQAFEHFRSLSVVRSFKEVVLFGRSSENVRALALRISEAGGARVHVARSAREAVGSADVVVTCTGAKDPILRGEDFRIGAHVNAIGACRPGEREIDLSGRDRLRIYLDSVEACLKEADEIVRAQINDPEFSAQVVGELGQCLNEAIPARRLPDEVTLFKSIGLGVEDVFAAKYFQRRALELGLGSSVEFCDVGRIDCQDAID